MSKLIIRETYTNETEGWQIDSSEWYEAFTCERGRLFRACQREYGACKSAIYVDTPTGTKAVGWYFERREQYEDSGRYGRKADFYTRGVWVEVREVVDSVDEIDFQDELTEVA